MSTEMTTTEINPEVLSAFVSSVRGMVVRPGDGAYDEARHIWNGMIDRSPAFIVQCTGAADVIAAVNFAREVGLPLSVRGGGHNVTGYAIVDGGIVIDLSKMKSVRVDLEKMRVRVGGGATLGDIDHETQPYGLAVPLGVVSQTGVAGLCLHGGLGYLMRKYGLTADNLVAADVVTAEGHLLHVDEANHADLLWALRGGGGNFGVVVSFEFRLHPVGPNVFAGIIAYDVKKTPDLLSRLRDYMLHAPDELGVIAVICSAPPSEPFPESYWRAPVFVILPCYSGALEEGERVIQPLRELDNTIVDMCGPMPFMMMQTLFDHEYPNGRHYYWRSVYLHHLSHKVGETLLSHVADRPSPGNTLAVWFLGGAVNRLPNDATAYARRDLSYMFSVESNWDNAADDEANIQWARTVAAAMQQFGPDGVYLNFAGFGENRDALVEKSYQGNYARLRAIKSQYDPHNLFQHNLNIRPAT